MSYLPCIEIEPVLAARAAVIWLHGLGADGHDFEPIVPELRLPRELAVRFVFPNAPSIPVTINGGMRMPAWYDILDVSIGRRVDETGLLASAAAIRALVDREIERGIDSRSIVLAGFSQGGAVAYQVALTHPQPLAGLLALSSYFATALSIVPHPANRGLPIEIHHGSHDPMVAEELGHQAHSTLLAMGYKADYRTYPMEHNVCAEQIPDISRWLQRVLPATNAPLV
ncbi:MAG: alpha/beta fold hydrolase [Pseudomonadales bacterium]|nr:alpha/beta fold hydrolase [Pseudomonadales bacterium]